MGIKRRLVFAIGLSLGFMSCVKKTQETPKEPLAESLGVKGCEKTPGTCLSIKKTALGKRFILIPTAKLVKSTPTWEAFQPQVFSFKQVGHYVAMYEENINTVYDDIRVEGLQQKFEIQSEDTEQVIISLGEGFKTLKLVENIEMPKALAAPKPGDSIVQVLDSLVKASTQTEDKIEIIQSVRVGVPNLVVTGGTPQGGTSSTLQTLEMRADVIWQIYSYEPNASFKVLPTDLHRRVGFFTASLQSKSVAVDKKVSIIHWDDTKTIQAKVSNSVPEVYREAVKTGLEYWNRALGKEIVRVEFMDEEKMNPGRGIVLIHWQKWEDGSGAIAKPQADPLTGEILGGHIDISEVFVSPRSGKYSPKQNAFSQSHLCNLETSLEISTATLSQKIDFTVWIAAHEMGHMMGLRHNFAGSFSNGNTEAELDEAFGDYLKTGKTKRFGSTTVMDYLDGRDAILTASYIRSEALPYDSMAMEYATQGQIQHPEVSRYCTDEDIAIPLTVTKNNRGGVYGCARFDSGQNPLAAQAHRLESIQDSLVSRTYFMKARQIFEAQIKDVKAPPISNLYKDLSIILSFPAAEAALSLELLGSAFTRVTKGEVPRFFTMDFVGNIIKAIEGNLTSLEISYVYFHMEDSSYRSMMKKHLEEAGGAAALLKKMLTIESSKPKEGWLFDQVIELSQSPQWKTIEFYDGVKFEVTDSDRAKILEDFAKDSDDLEKIYRKTILGQIFPNVTVSETSTQSTTNPYPTLNSYGGYSGSEVSEIFRAQPWILEDVEEEKAVFEVINSLLFNSTETVIGTYGSPQSPLSVELPKYKYRGLELNGPYLAIYSYGYQASSKIYERRMALKERILGGVKKVLTEIDPSLESKLTYSALVNSTKLKAILEELAPANLDSNLKGWLNSEIQFMALMENLN